jgi:hypothetical protein
MANIKIIGSPTVSQVLDGGTNSITLTLDISTTGSNGISTAANVGTSWQTVDTGSCADIRMIVISNQSTSSVQVATDAAGTNKIATAWAEDVAMIPWSGSNAFWAKSLKDPAVVQFMFQES